MSLLSRVYRVDDLLLCCFYKLMKFDFFYQLIDSRNPDVQLAEIVRMLHPGLKVLSEVRTHLESFGWFLKSHYN